MPETVAPPPPRLSLRLRRARRRLTFLALHAVFRVIGFRQAGTLGAVLGELQYRFSGRSRRRQQADLAALQGRPARDPQVRQQLRQAYRVNTAAVLEIMSMLDGRQDDALLASRCEIAGLDRLKTAMSGGVGAVLLGTHMGNGLMVPVRLASLGWPVSVVYREARMMSPDFFPEGLKRYGIEGIFANAGIRAYSQMLSALKQGRLVFLMLDQGVKHARDGVPLRFVGKNMPMPAGPAQLARHARAPVLPVATTAWRPRWTFEIESPLPLDLEQPLEASVETLARASERQILRHPELWSWHHRRWRKFPLAAA